MVRFGSCVVDIAARRVLRDDVEQHLEPQAFDLLVHLLEHHERVVSKAELLDEVWGDQFVSESALTTRVKEVRQALGDDGTRQAVVKNFRGRGYRFVAEIGGGTERRPAVRQPSFTTDLVGRDADIDEVGALLASARLVTLVGPGGVGKTSLANEVARRDGAHRADGVKVVQLARVRDAESVVHAVRRDTDLVEVDGDEDDLVTAIADLDALIVIDNCEHVLAEASRLVDAILRVEGDVRILATSRERLGVARERVWPVDPLTDESARTLLLDRARAVAPTYEWDDDEESSVSRLLTTLDRLPLAIEMAAARLPSIGATDLAVLLGERLDLLRSSDRSAHDRHRTVRTLISWSENLLDDDERDLLSALTVFAGAIAADDIASVVGGDSAELAVGALAGLVDKSLVVADTQQPATRYRLLETVRAIAAPRRLASSEQRHAHHVADVLADANRVLRTPDEPTAARRLDGLVAEIREAHRWARRNQPELAAEMTAGMILYAHDRQWTEPAVWARAIIDEWGETPLTLSASAAVAADASNRGDYATATHHAERAAASDDDRLVFSAHDTLANIGLYTGDFDATQRHGRVLVTLGDRSHDASARVAGALSIILGLVYAGRLDDAVEASELLDVPGPLAATNEAWIAYGHAELLGAAGRTDEAIEHFDRVIERASSVGSSLPVSVAQVSTLALRARTGDVGAAMAAFVPVLEQYRRTRSFTHAITGLRNLIELLVRAGHGEPAMVLLGALSTPDVKATYGSESERLDEARDIVSRDLGASHVASLVAHGAQHGVTWAIDYAVDVLVDIASAS